MSAFFICILRLLTVPLAACPLEPSSEQRAEQVQVKSVYDGDTLYLDDGRKVRLIGIDTPELKRPKEAFAVQAREALRALLATYDNQVSLYAGKDSYDHYGRLLAHVFLQDGRNVSRWMLAQGFATLFVIPPNLSYVNCYAKAEEIAQNQQLNIWKQRTLNLYIADLLTHQHRGYTRLIARISAVKQHKKSVTIYLRGGIRVKIKASDQVYFTLLDWDKLQGKQVSVTGILRRKGAVQTMYIRHPVYFKLSQ